MSAFMYVVVATEAAQAFAEWVSRRMREMKRSYSYSVAKIPLSPSGDWATRAKPQP